MKYMKILKFFCTANTRLVETKHLFCKRGSFSQTLFFHKTSLLYFKFRKEFEKTQLSQARKLRSKKTREQSEPSWLFMTS
jgi:hypothetical protein